MTNPFLCPECSHLGYCKKYYKEPSAKAVAEFDQQFYNRVNGIKQNQNRNSLSEKAVSTKVTSLKYIRSLYIKEAPLVKAVPIVAKNFMEELFIVPDPIESKGSNKRLCKNNGKSFLKCNGKSIPGC